MMFMVVRMLVLMSPPWV